MDFPEKKDQGVSNSSITINKGSVASMSSVSNLQFEKDLKKYQINYHNDNNFYRGFEDMQISDVQSFRTH